MLFGGNGGGGGGCKGMLLGGKGGGGGGGIIADPPLTLTLVAKEVFGLKTAPPDTSCCFFR